MYISIPLKIVYSYVEITSIQQTSPKKNEAVYTKYDMPKWKERLLPILNSILV
jgi:hypothetical protein